MKESIDKEKIIQEKEYEFPYHHIPKLENKKFKPYRNGTWGYHYLGKIQLIKNELNRIKFNTLIDLGCGDDRLLKKLIGLDY